MGKATDCQRAAPHLHLSWNNTRLLHCFKRRILIAAHHRMARKVCIGAFLLLACLLCIQATPDWKVKDAKEKLARALENDENAWTQHVLDYGHGNVMNLIAGPLTDKLPKQDRENTFKPCFKAFLRELDELNKKAEAEGHDDVAFGINSHTHLCADDFAALRTTGLLHESQWVLYQKDVAAERTGRASYNMSEQDLMECEPTMLGCNGAYLNTYFSSVSCGGQATEESLPYTASDSNNCPATGALYDERTAIKTQMQLKWAYVPRTSVDLEAAVSYAPTQIGIYVGSAFRGYVGGVIYCSWDSATRYYTNHAVTVVGYGIRDGTKYFLIKNSWGADWGLPPG
ncbi:hypothetical protein OEZ86_004629 [Tetradesmus obliquus]|nr:hypothetical protein OEZ86_004629 [Tetradesmus obliquus]